MKPGVWLSPAVVWAGLEKPSGERGIPGGVYKFVGPKVAGLRGFNIRALWFGPPLGRPSWGPVFFHPGVEGGKGSHLGVGRGPPLVVIPHI